MARAAGYARRQAAYAGLLIGLAAAGCAAIQQPPGGPPDFAPPVILAFTPDSGAVVEGFRDDGEIQFDEVINELSGGSIETLIRVSPRPEALSVSWKRSRVTFKPSRGWKPNVVYHVTLLPGITDLRNNRIDSTRSIIFSTGGPIPDTRVTGTVVNWEESRAAPRALLEALLLPDSLTYVTTADSVGDYVFAAIPRGSYVLFATIDQNSNGLREPREAFDSATVQLDSAASQVLWTFVHDSVGPRITAEVVDSVTVRVTFTQKLAPGPPEPDAVTVFALPDTVPVSTASVWSEAVYDSVRTLEAARARAAADTAEAADTADTAAADTARVPPPPLEAGPPEQEADTLQAALRDRLADLLAQRPRLSSIRVVRMAAPLSPGRRYLIVARATNLTGAVSEPQAVVTAPAVSDST